MNTSKSNFNIYAIGHAHLDPVWQWNKREGYQEVFATFRSALDRMNEFPAVCFVASSAQFYEWIVEAAPAMFAEIVARIKEGRWIPVGGWWVEADANCPAGESLVRQGLYAQKFFQKHFGRTCRLGFLPDTFGHTWTLPQILKKQGMDTFFFMRPEPHESEVIPAPLFRWQSTDGSTVLAVAIVAFYSTTASEIEIRIQQSIDRYAQTLPQVNDFVLFYGVGNHGGGPTVAAIQKIEALQKGPFPGIRFSSLENYVEKIQQQIDQLPTVRTELQHHARGCYSACADVKMWDRQTTAALLVAEKVASLASLIAHANYPLESLQAAWKKVLFNQFHDVLAGTAIEEAYRDSADDYGYAKSVANEIIMKAKYAIISAIRTEDPDYSLSSPFVVFNPCSWPVHSYLEFETDVIDLDSCGIENTVLRNSNGQPFPKEKIVLRDADGTIVPCQLLLTAAAKQESQPFRVRLLFCASVPSLGYQVYRLDYSAQDEAPKASGLTITKYMLENNRVRIQFDKTTGGIRSYFDKEMKREMFASPGAMPIVLEDWDDTWGHRIQEYDRELDRFGQPKFDIIEKGPERVRLKVTSFWKNSLIIQDFALCREVAELECKITIHWHEKYKVLKLSFPTVLKTGCCTFSIPYGFIERPMTGDEEPGQTWVDVSSDDENESFGFAVINDSKCGYSVKNGDIRLTVFHSTAWSHANPEVVTDQDRCRYTDQGIHEFAYKLVPHPGDWRAANIPRRAEEFLMRPLLFHTGNHKGDLPRRESFVTTDLNHVSISALKKAEDSDEIILRCVELYGLAGEGLIDIKALKRKFAFKIKPCEIKTFLIPLEQQKKVKEVNLLEE